MTFKEYLDSIKESPYHFSKRVYMAFNTIHKLYQGGKVRIDTAKRLHRLTQKSVPIDMMVDR